MPVRSVELTLRSPLGAKTLRDWGQPLSHVAVFFDGRLDDVIDL